MAYKKNDASPVPLFAKVVNASTGAPITSGVTAKHYAADGTQTTGDNSPPDHEGGGEWRYTPSQAETNETTFAVEFYHADAVGDGPSVQVVTDVLLGADDKVLISTDAQDLSTTLDVNTKTKTSTLALTAQEKVDMQQITAGGVK